MNTLAQRLSSMGKRAKYRNVKTVVDGITFASKAEAKRYGELKLLQRAGAISGLTCQPEFALDIDGERFGLYRGDFAYVEPTTDTMFNGAKKVCEDVKSKPTKTPLWSLKWKLAKALYPNVEFREINT